MGKDMCGQAWELEFDPRDTQEEGENNVKSVTRQRSEEA